MEGVVDSEDVEGVGGRGVMSSIRRGDMVVIGSKGR